MRSPSPSPSLRSRASASAEVTAPRAFSPPPLPQSYSSPSLTGGGGGSGGAGDYTDDTATTRTTPATPSSSVSLTSSSTISVKGAGGSASSRLHEKISRSRKLRAIVATSGGASVASSTVATPIASNVNNHHNNEGAKNNDTRNNDLMGSTSAPTSTTTSADATAAGTLVSASSSSSSVSSTNNNNNKQRETLAEKRRRAMARVGRLSNTSTTAHHHPGSSSSPPSSMAVPKNKSNDDDNHESNNDNKKYRHHDNDAAATMLSSSSSTLSSSHDKHTPATSSNSSIQKSGGTSSARNKHAAQRLKFKRQKEQQRANAATAIKDEEEEEEEIAVTTTRSGDSSSVKEKESVKKQMDAKQKSSAKQEPSVVVAKKNDPGPSTVAPATLLAASAPKKMEQAKQASTPMTTTATTTTSSSKCVATAAPLVTDAKAQAYASVACLPSWLKTKKMTTQSAAVAANDETDAESQRSTAPSLATTKSTSTAKHHQKEEAPLQPAKRTVVAVPCRDWMSPPPKQLRGSIKEQEEEEARQHHEPYEEEKKQQLDEDEPITKSGLPISSRSWMPTPQQHRTLVKEKGTQQQNTDKDKKRQVKDEPKAVVVVSDANKESNGLVVVAPDQRKQQQQQQPSRNKQDPPAICFPADYYYSRVKNKRADSSSVSVTADVGAHMHSKNKNNNNVKAAGDLTSKPKLRLAASPSTRDRELHVASGGGGAEQQQPSHRYASPSTQRESSSSLQQQQLTPERHNKMLEARRKASSSPAPPQPRQSPCTVPFAATSSLTTTERHQESNVRTKSKSSSSTGEVFSHRQQQQHSIKDDEKKEEEVKSEAIVKELQIAETVKATYQEEAAPRRQKDIENGPTTAAGLKNKKKVVEWPMPFIAGAAAATEHDDLLEATGSKSINTDQATLEEVDTYSYTDSLSLDTFKGKGLKGNTQLVKSIMDRRKDLGAQDERSTQDAEPIKGRWSPPPIPSASMSSDTAAAESAGPPMISEASSVRDDDERSAAQRSLSPPPTSTFKKTAGGTVYGPNKNKMAVENRKYLSPPRPSIYSSTGADSNESLSPVPLPPAPPNSAVKGQRNWAPPLPRGGAVHNAKGELFEPQHLRSLGGSGNNNAGNHQPHGQPKQGAADRLVRSPVVYPAKGELFEPPQLRSLGGHSTNNAVKQPQGQPKQGVADRFLRDLPSMGDAAADVLADNVPPQSIIEHPEKVCVSSMTARFNYAPGSESKVPRHAIDKQSTESDDDYGYIPRIRPSSGGSSNNSYHGLSTRPSDRFNVAKKFDSSASDHGSDTVVSVKSRYSSYSNDPRRSPPPLNVLQRSKLLERKPLDEEPMLQQSREDPVEGMPNAVIETPAKVNVASMAGMFSQTPGSKGRKTTGSAGKVRSSLMQTRSPSPSPGRRWGSPSPGRRNEAAQAGPKTPSWVKKVSTSSDEVDGATLPMSPSALKQQTSPVGRSLRSGSGESFSPRGAKSPVPLVSPRSYAANSSAPPISPRSRRLQMTNIDESSVKRVSAMPPSSPRTRLANNKSPVLHIWDKASQSNDMKRNSNAITIRSSSPLRIHDGPIGNRPQVPSRAIAPRMSTRAEPSSELFVDGVSTTIPEMPSTESIDYAPTGEQHLEQKINPIPFDVRSPSQAERMSNREMKDDNHVESDFFPDSIATENEEFQEFRATTQLDLDDSEAITGDSTNSGNRPPTAPISSTSPSHKTEKPWQKDLRTLPSHSWQKHATDEGESEMTKVREHLKKPRESDENSGTSTPTAQNLTPFTISKKNVAVFESDSYGEEKKSNKGDDALLPPAPNSLPRLAADSVRAVDYDKAIQGMMAKSATQSSSMELDEYSSGTGSRGAIPKELPPEFAHALDSQRGGGAVGAPPDPVVDKDKKSESESENEIVFGDPLTYGAAGGEAEKSPPRVSDRAKAIAAWKGGLGVRPKNRESDSQKSRKSSQSQDKSFAEDSQGDFGAKTSEGWNDSMPQRVSGSKAGRRGSPTKSDESRDSKAAATVTSGHQASRGASAVLRFWASTSQDEVAEAQDWKDRDPDVEDYGTDIPESPCDNGKLANKLLKKASDGGFADVGSARVVPDDGFTVEKVKEDAFGGFHSTRNDSVMDDVFGDFGATNNNSSSGRLVSTARAEQGDIVDLHGAQRNDGFSGWNDANPSTLPEMGLAPFSLENTAGVAFSKTSITKDGVNMFDPFSDEHNINDFGRPDDFFTGNIDNDGFGSAPFPVFVTEDKPTKSGIPDPFNTSSFPSFDTSTRRTSDAKPNAAVQKLEEALNAIAPSQDFDDENKPKFTANNDGFDPSFVNFPPHFDTNSSSRMAMKPRYDAGGIWSFDQAAVSGFEANKLGTAPFDAIAGLQKDGTVPRSEI